ncbi:hypothetical protein [Haliscomenobacter hydrossis]|uniref:Uncharacterized protein n=1 Tax=Haliscomenobacter hydrossis (strain ATCC 27775 / DSM 1100 / LMG 10767 / O) TaxID=760192 RepID=F4KQA9_HALH1|nr:hypothetical protein [Haliscomenobacter hydrossis]AEE48935.1 hypothetical protein Halhy_1036 [Haliscomenobacter hydrossis DSM 1100]
MNKLIPFFTFLLPLFIFAQAPQGLNYQAIAWDKNNLPKANQTITVTFNIRTTKIDGTIEYTETQTSTTTEQGYFTLSIGSIRPEDFKKVNWASGPKFLEVIVDGVAAGTTQMMSVPYALYAEKSRTTSEGGPNIAIYAERYPSGVPPHAPEGVSYFWTQRRLSNPAILAADFVGLNGSNLVFSQTGTYLISGSAAGYQTGLHKLCLREVGGNNTVKITGTSEWSLPIQNYSQSTIGVTVRTSILGVLVVTDTNIQYSLDHWLQQYTPTTSGLNTLGSPSSIPGVDEIYAQIMIQKIK